MGIDNNVQAILSHLKGCNSQFGVKLAINQKYKPQVKAKSLGMANPRDRLLGRPQGLI